MSTPIGHTLVGAGLASVVARLYGIKSPAKLLVGAAIASNLPDLDWVLILAGFPTNRFHRVATHSLLTLTALIGLSILTVKRLSITVDRQVQAIWAAALISHVVLDLFTTTSIAAAKGFGLPLLWPISTRRWAVRQDIFQSPGLQAYRTPGVAARAVLNETFLLGTGIVVLHLAVKLLHHAES